MASAVQFCPSAPCAENGDRKCLPCLYATVRIVIRYRRRIGKTPKTSHNAECGNVGAALLAENGKIYSGICIDNSCGIGTCAEHAAILDMLKEGVTRIHEIIAVNDKKIVLSPCGRCREMMMQINKENCNALVHLPKQRELKLSELLPEYWF